jgi:hypothetical protein
MGTLITFFEQIIFKYIQIVEVNCVCLFVGMEMVLHMGRHFLPSSRVLHCNKAVFNAIKYYDQSSSEGKCRNKFTSLHCNNFLLTWVGVIPPNWSAKFYSGAYT